MSDEPKIGETMLEVEVGMIVEDGRFVWRARGYRLDEFLHTQNPDATPHDDGWFYTGPFPSESAAERDREMFERAYFEFLDIEVEDAPDPRSLH
jgi:hypothetical protein